MFLSRFFARIAVSLDANNGGNLIAELLAVGGPQKGRGNAHEF